MYGSSNGNSNSSGDAHLIRGVKLKCVDGLWSGNSVGPIALGTQFLVLPPLYHARQRWDGDRPITLIEPLGTPLPDLDELNSEVPRELWQRGLSGEIEPPWKALAVV